MKGFLWCVVNCWYCWWKILRFVNGVIFFFLPPFTCLLFAYRSRKKIKEGRKKDNKDPFKRIFLFCFEVNGYSVVKIFSWTSRNSWLLQTRFLKSKILQIISWGSVMFSGYVRQRSLLVRETRHTAKFGIQQARVLSKTSREKRSVRSSGLRITELVSFSLAPRTPPLF